MRGELGNLPHELSSFVGRRGELVELKRLVADARLVTLVGVGGVGKTRLALRAAAERQRHFRDGVWLIEFDRIRDESLAGSAVVAALGLRDDGRDQSATIRQYLARRQALLVLDNCEHVADQVAKLADELLRNLPDLRILATSREPLAVAGETVLAVPPLATADPGRSPAGQQLERNEAVALFLERARAVRPGFELTPGNAETVARICHRLDGLPLAIELAAVRLRALAPDQVLDRLSQRLELLTRGHRERPPRQQTLRACIAWSHDLCTEAEQRLWARFSVFAGGVDLAAVEEVCGGAPLPPEEPLELITSLVDKSIIIGQGPTPVAAGHPVRYRMLESLREFGRERLAAGSEEQAIRSRHRDRSRRLVRQAAAEWIGPRQAAWLRLLDQELPEIRAALEFSLAEPDGTAGAGAAVSLAGDLLPLWIFRGLYTESLHWLGRALERPGPATAERVKALFLRAAIGTTTGDVAAAAAHADQARETAARAGDRRGDAWAAMAEGTLAVASGDPATGVARYAAARDAFRAEGEVLSQVVALAGLALTQALLGDAAAVASNAELLELCRPRGEPSFSGFAATTLGIERWRAGDLGAAADHLMESLRLLRPSGNPQYSSWCLEVAGWIAADGGRHEHAAVLFGAAATFAEVLGTRTTAWPDLIGHHDRMLAGTRSALGDPAFERAYARGRKLSPDDAFAYALGEPARGEPGPEPGREPASGGPAADPLAPLTRREREVADLVAEGLSNKEIAGRLVISTRTAEGHVDHIMLKLGCTSRVQVATLAAGHRNAPSGPAGT